MSRSIGDLIAGSIGVTCEPGNNFLFYSFIFINIFYIEILEHEIGDECKFIILASDGVWEFMENRKVMNIVYPYYGKDDPDGAVNALTKEANNEWEKVNFFIFL
jgi:serine/threonine protein phosphatase PrpC